MSSQNIANPTKLATAANKTCIASRMPVTGNIIVRLPPRLSKMKPLVNASTSKINALETTASNPHPASVEVILKKDIVQCKLRELRQQDVFKTMADQVEE